jgi:hypothetical protein
LALPIAVTGSANWAKARRVKADKRVKNDDFQRPDRREINRATKVFFIAFFMDAEQENRYANVFFFC